jgi:ABC-2 type transport system ATP-binding protein
VFLSSHNMSEVDEVCDSVVIVDRGRTVWDGTLEQLRAEAPAPTYRLETSDDARALRIGRFEAGVELEPIGERGLRLRAGVAARDEYVLTLGRFGVAVRTLEPEVTPLEALFDRLTAAA